MSVEIVPIPAFQDNYLWVGLDRSSGTAFVVDPGDPSPVSRFLHENQLSLTGILITHHHPDHTGGIAELTEHFDCPVYGPQGERFPWVTQPLSDGDTLSMLDCEYSVIETPGHTIDHICYFSLDKKIESSPVLFAGDTLFAAGCGRLFEGSPGQMLNSLSRIASLPTDTHIYCAHEYTLSNLAFAQAVEPHNQAIQKRLKACQSQRDNGLPTVPSILAEEILTNPFLRTAEESVTRSVLGRLGHSPASQQETFAVIRQWKDTF